MPAKKKEESKEVKKPAENAPERRKRKKTNGFVEFFKLLFGSIWWVFKGIGWLFIGFFKGIYWLAEKTVDAAMTERPSYGRGKLKSTKPNAVSKITVLETERGNYKDFWTKLKTSDSMIGIIVGARGSGKSAVALSLLENLKGGKKKFFAMGFQSKDLPDWIATIESVNDIENDSYVVVDEGGILFSSRESMSAGNKLLSELLFIARHKNLTIFFISQNSSNIEINTIRQSDFIVLKKSSLLQKDFERKKISEIYTQYGEGFDRFKNNKGLTLIYSDQFVGFVNNELPSFWSENVSKGFRDSK
jgi:hypothetical protein